MLQARFLTSENRKSKQPPYRWRAVKSPLIPSSPSEERFYTWMTNAQKYRAPKYLCGQAADTQLSQNRSASLAA